MIQCLGTHNSQNQTTAPKINKSMFTKKNITIQPLVYHVTLEASGAQILYNMLKSSVHD